MKVVRVHLILGFQLKKSMFTLSKDRLLATMIPVVENRRFEGVLVAGTH